MRILIFYQYFGTNRGGWSTRIYELSRHWTEAGHDVVVVTAPYEKSDIVAEEFITQKMIDNIHLIIIKLSDSNRKPVSIRAINATLFACISTWYALTLKSDIIIASSGPITLGIPALFAKLFKGKKYAFEVRDLWPQGAIELGKITNKLLIRIGNWFEALCYRNASLVVPASSGIDDHIRNRFPECKTLVIPHGSSPNFFLKTVPEIPNGFMPSLSEKKVFLYAGSLGLMDDCLQILKGYMLAQNNDIALIFLGDGAERSLLESFAARNKLHNVHFLGLIPKIEVAKWFSIATASIITFKDYPVLHTSSPNKLFDSLAAGVPFIHNTRGWIKSLAEDYQCGISVNPNAPQELADAILCLASNPDLLAKMRVNARKLAETEFEVSYNAQRYIMELQSICNPK